MGKTVSLEERRASIDLLIILAVTFTVLGLFMSIQDIVVSFARDTGVHVLLRTLILALLQFGTAGLGISLIALIRRESFLSYGLRRENTLLSIALCTLAFVPYLLFGFAFGKIDGYLPFRSVWTTQDLLNSNFIVGAVGYFMIAIAWGFFESFNYVVISDKINKLLPAKSRWLNWGAIICGLMCIMIHGMIGFTLAGIIEMLTVFIIIYGMLVTRYETGNAWGCVFVFVFLWNAF